MRSRSDLRPVPLFCSVLLATAAAAQSPPSSPQPAAQPPVAQPPVAQPPAAPGAPTGPDAAAAETRLISLDAAVRQALQANPTLDEAEAAVRRARAVVDEARALQLPRLDGNARFTVQGPIPSFTFTTPPSAPGEQPRTQEISLGRTFTRNFSVGASYNPDPFGRLRANREGAQRNVNVARGGYYITQNELVFAVQSLYLQALRSRELIQVSREALEAAQEQLRVAEAGLRAGTAAQFDVLRSSVQVANNRQNLVTAEGTYRRSLAALAEVLSLQDTSRLELVPVALPPEPDQVAADTAREVLEPDNPQLASGALVGTPVPGSVETALSEAFNRRPEIYQAEWARRAAQSRVRFERLGNYPSIDLSAGFQYNPDVAGFAVVDKTWSLIANVAIPIWDAGLARARTRQARADVDAAAARLRAQQDAVREEVRRSLVDLEEAAERRRSAQANSAQAREALRVARVRYQAGLGTTVEVTDAEAALTQARANEVNAGYDYLSALSALNRSLGRYAGESLTELPR